MLHLATLPQTGHRVIGRLSVIKTTKEVGTPTTETDAVQEVKVETGDTTDRVGIEAGIDKEGTHLITGDTAIQVPAPNDVPGAQKDPQKDIAGPIRERGKGSTMIPNKETHRSTNPSF